jgi:hypothetical protein
MIRTTVSLYFVLMIVFRFIIFYRSSHPCPSEIVRQLTPAHNLVKHSDRYDQNCVNIIGEVTHSGSEWWDIWFIRTYRLRLANGRQFTVFTYAAVPAEGSALMCSGTFRQFYRGKYFHWIGIVEYERTHSEHHKKHFPKSEKTNNDTLSTSLNEMI